MKSGPYKSEMRFVEYLNIHFAALGLSPVERIPLLGRRGPDISFNELWLAIDAKRRIEVPAKGWMLTSKYLAVEYGDEICISLLKNFSNLLISEEQPKLVELNSTRTIAGYLSHMAEWAMDFHHKDMPASLRSAIPAVVCKKTGGYTANALFVINKEDLRLLRLLYKEIINGKKKT